MSFESLKVAELRRAADEDFAVEVGEKASKPEVLAALVESGVTWDMYLAQHPEAAWRGRDHHEGDDREGQPVPRPTRLRMPVDRLESGRPRRLGQRRAHSPSPAY